MYTQQHILKSIIDNNDDMVFALDLEKRYLLFNKAHMDSMKSKYGADIAEGVCMLDYIAHTDDIGIGNDVFEKVTGGEIVNVEAEFGCESLLRGYTALHIFPLKDETSAVFGLAAFARNISKEKSLEKENTGYADKMEMISSELSHKLRKPVATILGLVQFIDNAETNTDVSEIIRYLKESTDELDMYIKEMTALLEEKPAA